MGRDKNKIGMLGLGRDATTYYYEKLGTRIGAENIALFSLDFDTINAHLPNNFDCLEPALSDGLKAVQTCKAIIIPNITLHETFDRLNAPLSDLPIMHPVHLTLARLKQAKLTTAALLGSTYTMRSLAWKQAFKDYGIEPFVLPDTTAQVMDDFRCTVYAGLQTDADILQFQNRVKTYSEKVPVIIACTELSLFAPRAIDTLFDTAEIQINEAVKRFTA